MAQTCAHEDLYDEQQYSYRHYIIDSEFSIMHPTLFGSECISSCITVFTLTSGDQHFLVPNTFDIACCVSSST